MSSADLHTPWRGLVYVVSGAVDVVCRGSFWQLRPGQALWHSELSLDSMRVPTGARVLRLGHEDRLCNESRIFYGSALLREALVRLADYADLLGLDEVEKSLMVVIRSEMTRMVSIPITPPWPVRAWASQAALELVRVGRSETPIEEVAARFEMSRRSFERRFLRDSGLSPGDWRREARLIEALRLVSIGLPVEGMWERVGFGSRAAFFSAFRGKYGAGPDRLWRQLLGSHP